MHIGGVKQKLTLMAKKFAGGAAVQNPLFLCLKGQLVYVLQIAKLFV